jgi:hypothetical protein
MTAVPLGYVVEQVPVAGGPLISAQLICGVALPTTVPTEVPSSSTSKVKFVVAGPTVRRVEPQTDPVHAVTVVVPAVAPKAAQRLVASLVRLATALLEELQVTEVNVSVLPSLKTPVAINR